jgi:NADPH2:quinone reductase
MRSLVKANGTLELSLQTVPTPVPGEIEVVVRIEAAPINPSDLGLLLAGADMSTAQYSGSATQSVVTANLPERALKVAKARIGQSMPIGNEGAGVVIAAGSSAAAQALLGKTVALISGATYSQYCCARVSQCLELGADATPVDGASSFVNPLTALGMVETMRREGHKALVQTAAASNLGQMLVRICLEDKVGLVNIVRSAEQVKLLQQLGAVYICNSEAPSFMEDLTEALVATGATIAFDAIGGGTLASRILSCMEAALTKSVTKHSIYGSPTHKQLYIYGGLDMSPTEVNRSFGMAWGMGGWLLFPFLERIGPVAAQALKNRVVARLKTTFASSYSGQVNLVEALSEKAISAYSKRATGTKYLIVPKST